jgi:hypothetical protein
MPDLTRINWKLLGHAVNHYEMQGYRYVEVPYAVPKDIIRLTLPPEYDESVQPVEPFGCLVGSAEQSLLFLDLPPGQYVACSALLPTGAGVERHLPVSLHEGGTLPDRAMSS